MTKSTMAASASTLTGVFVVCVSSLLAGCAGPTKTAGVEPIERVVGPRDPVAPGGGRYQVGKAYSVGGRTYVPREDPNYDASGLASWYGGDFHHGTRTANGEVVDRHAITAAHPTLPLPSYARVTNQRTGRSIVVRINDRGPYAQNRILDMSEKTAELLGMKTVGVDRVRVQYVGRAGLAGSDQKVLMASLRGPGVAPAGDDRILVAQADLPVGPRRPAPAGAPASSTLMVASIAPAPAPAAPAARPIGYAPASTLAMAPTRPTPLPRGLVVVHDAFSMDLAGVDAAALRAAAKAGSFRPASSSAEVIASELPGASGAPLAIGPDGKLTGLMPVASPRAYAAESRIASAHALFEGFGDGESLASLTR